jgi:transcriptional regulator with XRE-family HTH domain
MHHHGEEVGLLADKEAAERLKHVLRIAMAEKGVDSWSQIATESGVSPTTIENWIYGRTVPRAKELRMVGEWLRPFSSPSALETAYAGLPPEEPPIVDVLRELAPDLHELVILLRAQADQDVLEAVRDALEERRRGRGGPRPEPLDTLFDETDP